MMKPRPVEYSTVTRTSPRRVVVWAIGGIALVTLCIWALESAVKRYKRYHYSNRDGVRAVLEAVRGTRIVNMGGFEEGVLGGWTVVTVTAHVDGRPDRRIVFDTPTPADLRSGSHIRVTQVGPYEFSGHAIDIGRDGDFRNLLPFQLGGVEDLITRYDEVTAALGRLPRSGTVTSATGSRHSYRIEVKGNQPPARAGGS